MPTSLIAIAIIFILLMIAEYFKRQKILSPENSRKFIHISVGTYVATWPFFLSTQVILLFCVAFVAVVLASRYFKIFSSIHGIERKTWGDILFPVGVAATALLAQSPWVFAAAMLHLSIADGAAAIVGVKWGMNRKYYIINGYVKTVLGSAAFLVCSFIITGTLIYLAPADSNFANLGLAGMLVLPLLATMIENVSVKGFDNISVPVSLALIYNFLLVLV